MIPAPHGFKLSQQERDRLLALKRHTGLKNWNTLCRWALCLSLAEPSQPPRADIPSDSSVEMTWQTFGGPYASIYWSLLLHRCRREGIEPWDARELHLQFRLHLHRGINYLAGDANIRNITAFVRLAVDPTALHPTTLDPTPDEDDTDAA